MSRKFELTAGKVRMDPSLSSEPAESAKQGTQHTFAAHRNGFLPATFIAAFPTLGNNLGLLGLLCTELYRVRVYFFMFSSRWRHVYKPTEPRAMQSTPRQVKALMHCGFQLTPFWLARTMMYFIRHPSCLEIFQALARKRKNITGSPAFINR